MRKTVLANSHVCTINICPSCNEESTCRCAPIVQGGTSKVETADICQLCSSGVLPIVVKQRATSYWECPHCNSEVYEKHTYFENEVHYHSDCKGALRFPSSELSEVLAYSNKGKETREYKITAKPYQLNLLEEFFSMVQYCGSVGASRGIQLFIDGDGGGQIRFERSDKTKLQEYPEDIDIDADPVKMRGIE